MAGNPIDRAGYEEIRGSYLGDGVYAAFDGWQVWVSLHEPVVNRTAARNPTAIALEPKVFQALMEYGKQQGMITT